jgi:hypothetical protein
MATTLPPYTAVVTTLARSRFDGMNTKLRSPARAAWAATELARFPVDAQAAVLKPNSSAFDSATDATRSLNELVGLSVSFFTHTSPSPRAAASRSARTSGVKPAPRSTAWPRSTGKRSA